MGYPRPLASVQVRIGISATYHIANGGIFADPYHTYLSLAVLSVLPADHGDDASWKLPQLDALWNATEETAAWGREHIPAQSKAL